MHHRPARRLGVLLAALAATALPAAGHADEKDQHAMNTATGPAHTNRLIRAISPYLLQHAHNPVDWYEWGPAALEKAKKEDKPIFLSIGYSACHWCHVMARESFENEQIAAIMNKYFISIKVDREERPDLDEIYMQATLALNRGQGGWPMSVWLTPDLRPFFAGTYFPPEDRYGRPGFKNLCEQIGQAWTTRRDEIEAFSQRLTTTLATSLKPSADGDATLTLDTLDNTVSRLADAFDRVRGGIAGDGTNKFPPSMAMDLMLRAARRNPDSPQAGRLVQLVTLTLDNMARGGIYDQLGGGIHRYSTDADWRVPHFEKMLYDQALVSRIYLDAYQYTRNPLYARIAGDIFDYVITDLQSPEGGFYSTRDADSEGAEGKYYVWTRDEIVAALGRDDAALFCSYYDVSAAGNWQDPENPDAHKNILAAPRDLATVAKANKIEPAELERRLAGARHRLREIRAQRVPPRLDDKILCEWNGLMIAALARGGGVLGEPKYVAAAGRAADFILANQYERGRLLRAYRDGRKLETAFLNDYAAMIDGLIELYEATFDKRWLDAAGALNDALIAHHWDAHAGGFFFTPADHEQLIARSKDVRDAAVPSGNSVQLLNLLRLSVMRGDEKLREMAEKTMRVFAADVSGSPHASERFLAAVEFALVGPVELAIVGDPADAATQALLGQIHRTYLPNRVLMLYNPGHPAASPASPLLKDRGLVDGKPAAYVCRNYTCKPPVTTPEDLAKQLAER